MAIDPVSLILTALVSGTTNSVVKDVYESLKALIHSKFAGKPDAQATLAKHEKKPEIWEKPLEAELIEVGADKDEEILKKAQELLKLANPEEAAKGTFNIKTGDVKGIVAGQISGGDFNQTIH